MMSKQISEKRKRYLIEYRIKNKEKMSEYNKKRLPLVREKRAMQNSLWYSKNREHSLKVSSIYTQKIRLKVLLLYSNNNLKCACCGENEFDFLTIDHIQGGGRNHRNFRGSNTYYNEMIKENNPDKYQVLCMNCNHAKHIHKICPHQKIKKEPIMTKQEPEHKIPTVDVSDEFENLTTDEALAKVA